MVLMDRVAQQRRPATKSRKVWAEALRSGDIATIRDGWRRLHDAA
jgi:hypothetical protein